MGKSEQKRFVSQEAFETNLANQTGMAPQTVAEQVSDHPVPVSVPAAPTDAQASPTSEPETRSYIVEALLTKANSNAPPLDRNPFTGSLELAGLVDVAGLLVESSSLAVHRKPAPDSETVAYLGLDGFRETNSGKTCPWHFDFHPSDTSRDPKNANRDLRIRCGDVAQYGEIEEMGLPVFQVSINAGQRWFLVVVNDRGESGWLQTRAPFLSMTKLWKEKFGAYMTVRWDGRVFDRPVGSFGVRNVDTFYPQPFEVLATRKQGGRLW